MAMVCECIRGKGMRVREDETPPQEGRAPSSQSKPPIKPQSKGPLPSPQHAFRSLCAKKMPRRRKGCAGTPVSFSKRAISASSMA